MKNKNNIYLILLALLGVLSTSCDKYLDIVPEKTQELELLFNRKEQAYRALATCYSYLPKQDNLYETYVLATDELTTPLAQTTAAIDLMRGMQSANSPMMSLWEGFGDQRSLFQGISDCNILIENIRKVPDMTEEEKKAWEGEATFLKAYYHFLLIKNYGPIPIMDRYVPISTSVEDLRIAQSPVDACFDYVAATLDKAMELLPESNNTLLNAGRVDKVIAAAIKSKALLYAASPLFNGNSEFYSDHKNSKGEVLFSLSYDPEKWNRAIVATREAIALAQESGAAMYNYNLPYPEYDEDIQNMSSITAMYDYRLMFTEKWNSEIIWGNSNPTGGWTRIQAAALMKHPTASSNEAAWQWLSPTLRMAELYYTENGLPISEDLSFDYAQRYDHVLVSNDNALQAQPGEYTAQLHLDREPRFYASIGFDRGYARLHGDKFETQMRWNESPGGRKGSTNDYLLTGYLLKKFNHPDASGATYNQLIDYAWPHIRMAELYLNLAEALNEYQGPGKEVYDALNIVRERAGVPNVEVAWGNALNARSLNKHLDPDGLREIIRQERLIELAFEGHRYDDIRRWKLADEYFNVPVMGWNVNSSEVDDFYELTNTGTRSFITPRDYFHPISIIELTKNPKLVQNPGW